MKTNKKKIMEFISFAKNGVKDLSKIISGILIHFRNEKAFILEDVDLNKIIIVENLYCENNHDYKYKIEKDCELSEKLTQIKVKPVQIMQVVDNINRNAIDAMEKSKEKKITTNVAIQNIFFKVC